MRLSEAKALYRADATPTRVKVALVVLIAYLLCPIDIIPDFIPVLGQLDDIIVAGLLIGYISRVLTAQERAGDLSVL
jgi:uncharacterized membrane protein YkvA (DUF1232 family)